MSRPDLIVTSTDVTADVTMISVVGELDIRTEAIVRDEAVALLGRGRTRLVFDLAGLTFCDSTGMGTFIDLSRAARAHHGWIRLAALQPFILESFQMLNLQQVLDLYRITDTAIAGSPAGRTEAADGPPH